jgi:hypothetical protein
VAAGNKSDERDRAEGERGACALHITNSAALSLFPWPSVRSEAPDD